MSVFDSNNRVDHTSVSSFLDPTGGPTIQRYDTLKYKQFDQLTDKQLGFFWRPEEVDIYQDAKDFKSLTEHEQHIFTSNLKRQILLDSVQGRAPAEAFGSIVSLPELENWIITWTFSETIHSRSYTHIIRNIYSNPSKIFDEMLNVKEIVDCADSISGYYDDLIEMAGYYNLLGVGTHTVNGKKVVVDLYQLKKMLYLTLMSVNILEGVRFYVSFACSWAFAELKKMEGNAKIIKLIARDENLHLASTQMMLKLLKQEDPDFVKIEEETRDECTQMFVDAVDQEKEWANYLFKDGSMIGLNAAILKQYIEYISNQRLSAIGFDAPFDIKSNPLPWMNSYLVSDNVQVAPQETEISSYLVGQVDSSVSSDDFDDFDL
jgi:ribonucleoside-diphosphate reductase beta chain